MGKSTITEKTSAPPSVRDSGSRQKSARTQTHETPSANLTELTLVKGSITNISKTLYRKNPSGREMSLDKILDKLRGDRECVSEVQGQPERRWKATGPLWAPRASPGDRPLVCGAGRRRGRDTEDGRCGQAPARLGSCLGFSMPRRASPGSAPRPYAKWYTESTSSADLGGAEIL